MNENYNEVKRMRKILSILLAAILAVLACTLPVCADDDDNNEADEDDDGKGSSGDDRTENSVPGFEFALGGGALIAATRLLQTRQA